MSKTVPQTGLRGPGTAAPEVELASLEGKTIRLSSLYRERPTVVVFIRHDCPVSQYTLPFIERLHQGYASGAHFLGISQDEAEPTRALWERLGLQFPALLDRPHLNATRGYGVTVVPSVFLIGTDGIIRLAFDSFRRAELVRLSELLAEQLNRPPAPVFQPGEKVPEIRPG
jgi:peroxiredoxin